MVIRRHKPERIRLPRGEGKPRGSRVLTQGDGHKLVDWVRRHENLARAPSLNKALDSKYSSHSDDAPDPIGCDAGVVKIIQRTRSPIYPQHRLKKGNGVRTKIGLKSAQDEFERRNVERELYRELSRYYRLEWNQVVWERPPLLRKGKHKHDRSTF